MSISAAGVFRLLERLNMKFPSGKGGLDDKLQFGETVSFKLTSVDKTITGS
jgi:hypothetical protein